MYKLDSKESFAAPRQGSASHVPNPRTSYLCFGSAWTGRPGTSRREQTGLHHGRAKIGQPRGASHPLGLVRHIRSRQEGDEAIGTPQVSARWVSGLKVLSGYLPIAMNAPGVSWLICRLVVKRLAMAATTTWTDVSTKHPQDGNCA